MFITTTLKTSVVVVMDYLCLSSLYLRLLTNVFNDTLAPQGIIPLDNPYGIDVKPRVISCCFTVNKNMCQNVTLNSHNKIY